MDSWPFQYSTGNAIKWLAVGLLLLVANVYSVDLGDRTVDPEIGMSFEEPPIPKDKIPVEEFDVLEGAPKIDGLIDDEFWKQCKR